MTPAVCDEIDGGESYTNGSAVGDFDHIPELDQLQQKPEFKSLNLMEHSSKICQLLSGAQSAILTVTELELVILTQEEGDKEGREIIRTRIQMIFSCSQVR